MSGAARGLKRWPPESVPGLAAEKISLVMTEPGVSSLVEAGVPF